MASVTGDLRGRRRMATLSNAVPRPSGALGLEAAALILSIIGCWAASGIWTNPAWSFAAIVNYLWMFTLLFRIEPRVTVLELPQFITRASTVIALIFVEFGNPIPELGTVGTAGPFACGYVFYMGMLFATCTAAFRLIIGPPGRLRESALSAMFDRYANLIALAAIAGIAAITLWLVLRGLTTGFPLLAGVDRFVYRRLMGDKITVYALNFKYVIQFILGMIAFRLPVARIIKLAATTLFLILTVIFFLFADKFFTQLVAVSGFAAPYLYVNHAKVRRNLLGYTLIMVGSLSAVFSVTWFIYSNGGQVTPAATMRKLSGRMVGQGELWYVQSRVGAPLMNFDRDLWDRNVDALTVDKVDLYAVQQSLGPNYFSNRYAPDDIKTSILNNAGSVTYTAALEPLGLVMFGWAGLAVLQVVLGCLMALSTGYLAVAIVNRSLPSAVFAAYVWIQFRYFLSQGTPWVIISVFAVKWLLVIALIELGLVLIGRSQRRRPRPGLAAGA